MRLYTIRMNAQILNQLYDETLAMLSDAMHYALNNQSWLNQFLADEANNKLRSVEAWLELQPKFKVKETMAEKDETDTIEIPDEDVMWYSESDDELAAQTRPITVRLKSANIDAELKILEDVADWVRRRPKFKIRTTIRLKHVNVDAELKILEGINEYIRHLPRLKVRNQPINYEEMFMRKTGLGPEQYEAMQDTWQEIRHRMQDFARCWKQNNYRRSQVLDSKGNIIETCWRNFKARFMISFDQDLEQAIRDYTPRHDATPPPDATAS